MTSHHVLLVAVVSTCLLLTPSRANAGIKIRTLKHIPGSRLQPKSTAPHNPIPLPKDPIGLIPKPPRKPKWP